ncbi:uncharacterized protein [Nyctibius grandis]|uniref:uncharacterized protein n=1 Tax=Nyctibius grandis TaxID=48427 RepID=UPI0035BC63E5
MAPQTVAARSSLPLLGSGVRVPLSVSVRGARLRARLRPRRDVCCASLCRQQRRKKKKGVVWNGEARASEKRSGGGGLKSGHESGALGKGTSRSLQAAARAPCKQGRSLFGRRFACPAPFAQGARLRARLRPRRDVCCASLCRQQRRKKKKGVVWNGEARASEKRSGGGLKSRHESGALGKGTSRSRESAAGTFGVPRLALRWATSLSTAWLSSLVPVAAGEGRALWLPGCRPACNQGPGLGAFCSAGSLCGATGPVSGVRVRVPLKRREGASAGLWDQGCPVSQGPASPGRFAVQAAAQAPCKQGRSLFGRRFACPAPFAQGARLRARLRPRRDVCCASLCRQQRRKKKKGVVWNGEARASEKRSGGGGGLKSGHESGALGKGTSRSRESAAGTFGVPRLALRWATSLRQQRRKKKKGVVWNGEARASEKRSGGGGRAEERARERRSGQRHLAVTRQQRRKKKKGVVWNGEARASEKRSGGGGGLKSGHESGALGKGTSRSRESAAGTFGVPRLALRWATSL